MQFEIPHPDFQQQRLSLKTPGLFSGSVLLVNGAPVTPVKGQYEVTNDAGTSIFVRLKSNFPDFVPTVLIGDDSIRLAPPLAWYEIAWCLVPIILLFVGGAIGGGIGGLAASLNLQIFRTEQGFLVRYGLIGVTTFLAFVAYFVVAIIVHILINGPVVQR